MARRELSTDPRAVRTRATLIDSTIALLQTNRSEKLSVSQIVKEGNLSRQVFYEHFEDRDALLFAAAEKIIERVLDWVRENSAKSTPAESIEGILGEMEPNLEVFRNLIDGPVHWRVHSYAASLILPFLEARIRRDLEAFGAELTDEHVEYTAKVIASGLVDQLTTAVREGLSAQETGRRIKLMRETLSAL